MTGSPTIVIAAGGSGGHIYPGLALARQLKSKGVEIVFIGSDNRMETEKIPEARFAFRGLPIRPLKKKKPIRSILNLMVSVKKALKHLKSLQPASLVGMGSYISVPTVLAAYMLRIPIVLVSTDVAVGKANLFLSRFATIVTLAFETEQAISAKKTQLCGIPLRAEIGNYSRNDGALRYNLDPDKKTLLIVGGSQGAQRLNEVVINILPDLLALPELQVVHVCGEKHFDGLKEQTNHMTSSDYHLLDYVAEMPALLACTDLAISRAGALAIAEFLACQIPTILIPGLFGGGHQLHNAKMVSEAEAGVLITEDSLTDERLQGIVSDVIRDTEKLKKMSQNCNQLNSINATETISNMILDISQITTSGAAIC